MIIDCISDLHGFYPELEGGDLLIIAGDCTARDEFIQWQDFATWLARQKYRRKIFIGGNHDNFLFHYRLMIMPIVGPQDLTGVEFLMDSGTEFEGLKIWGSPWTKTFEGMNPHCKAFTVDTEEELADKFEKIPHDTDILITHSPPYGILDKVNRDFSFPRPSILDELYEKSFHVGSHYLYIWFKYVKRPKLHVFGHIHEGYGLIEHFSGYNDTMVKSVNASHVDAKYKPVNKPIRVIL